MIYYDQFKSKAIDHKLLHPSALGLVPDIRDASGPSTSQAPSSSTQTRVSANAPLKRKVGRPRNDSKRPVEKEVAFEEDDLISHRTKSGRIIKLNPDIAKIFQIDPDSYQKPVNQDVNGDQNKGFNQYSMEQQIQVPVMHNQISEISQQPEPKLLPGLTEPPKRTRKISSEFRCTTCKKIYLGKNKMNHHFKLFPDHRPKASENDSVLFSHLMSIVRQKKKNEDMANVFFKELSNFVQLCEKLTPKLITNKDNHPNTLHHIVDKNAASLLRINPGHYRLNMNVFDKNFKLDNPIEPEVHEEPEPETILDGSDNQIDDHHLEDLRPATIGKEVIKVLDDKDVPSLDGNEVNLLIRQTNELTNLTNISDIVGETEKIEQHITDDNALLEFLN